MPVRTLLAALIALFAAPVFAGDGVVEINQACVAAGCFAGDAAGLPVTIMQPGSYRLTSNLAVPDANTNAIEIHADAVSVDLGGFAIRGPTLCTGEPVTSCTPTGVGAGILSESGTRARIFNGTIEGMGGSAIGSSADTRIWDLTVAHSGGTGVFLGRGASLRNSTVVFSGDRGVRGNSGGGFAEIAGCTVRGNKTDAVAITAGLVVDSRLQNNGGQAIAGGGDVGYGGNVMSGNVSNPSVTFATPIACNLVEGGNVCPP
jgi:hypothetical protein